MTLVHDHDGLDESVWLGLERDEGLIHRIRPGARFDRHFHDCDEYWLVFAGSARVLVGSRTFDVGPGDIVCTPTGTVHDVVAVRETLEAFWLEGATPEGGRIGHLHESPEDAAGHVVPLLTDGGST